MAAAHPPAIELIGIDKKFGAVHANKDINLSVAKGTIHGIIGENGAGKSTLMSILYGFYHADSGEIKVNGKTAHIRTSQDAIAAGIGMVHQHFMLVENFSVLENIILGVEGGALLKGGEDKARARLKQLADEYELDVDPDAADRGPAGRPAAAGGDFESADARRGDPDPRRADRRADPRRGGPSVPHPAHLKDQGKTIMLITHKLREIMAITDNVSVMRRGEMVATRETAKTSPQELAELMVGRRVLLEVDKGPAKPGKEMLRVEGLTVRDEWKVARVDNVSFNVRAGEIVGIAGVSGNGQSELLATLAGIKKAVSGKIIVDGEPVDPVHEADPAKMRERGVAHVPEDRQHMGLVLPFEESENSILGYHESNAYGSGAMLDPEAVRADAAIKDRASSTSGPTIPRLKTANFSGGNQQKIVLAREMERDPKVLLVGQPTRGVDIGAIEFIHKQLISMRDAGQGDPAGLGRARRNPLAVRPRAGHVRRADRRRGFAGDGRGRDRAADGRD